MRRRSSRYILVGFLDLLLLLLMSSCCQMLLLLLRCHPQRSPQLPLKTCLFSKSLLSISPLPLLHLHLSQTSTSQKTNLANYHIHIYIYTNLYYIWFTSASTDVVLKTHGHLLRYLITSFTISIHCSSSCCSRKILEYLFYTNLLSTRLTRIIVIIASQQQLCLLCHFSPFKYEVAAAIIETCCSQ